MPPTSIQVERSQLGTSRVVGGGSQATVHAVDDFRVPGINRELAFKEYLVGDSTLHLAGLESIVRFRAELSADDQERLDRFAAWPVATVTDGGHITGILMPLVNDPFTFDLQLRNGTTERRLCTLQYAFIAPDRARQLGAPAFDAPARLRLAVEFARAFDFLHERNIVFGDISANNALLSVDACRVMLVDCDAVRIKGCAPVVPQLNSPDWDPPPVGGTRTHQTVRTDVYKFGLLVLRLLSPGAFASTQRSPQGQIAGLNPTGMDLLHRSLDPDDRSRPAMREWVTALTSLETPGPSDEVNGSGRTVGPYRERPGGGWIKVAGDAEESSATTSTSHGGWERGHDGGWVRRGE